MKLYTRLIDSGTFIYWKADEGDNSYNLKVRIINGNDKIELVNLDVPQGQNYFTFDKIGFGDYEIELNGYRSGKLYQTEVKNIKISSMIQNFQEQTDKIITRLKGIEDYVFYINATVGRFNDLINDQEELARIMHNVNYYKRKLL